MDVEIIDSLGDVVIVARNVDYNKLKIWIEKNYRGYNFSLRIFADELSKS